MWSSCQVPSLILIISVIVLYTCVLSLLNSDAKTWCQKEMKWYNYAVDHFKDTFYIHRYEDALVIQIIFILSLDLLMHRYHY